MISAAFSETFLCWRLFRRACKPLVSSVPGGGATHGCEVVLVGDVTVEGGQGSLLTDAGVWLTKVGSAKLELELHQSPGLVLFSVNRLL